MPGSVLIQLVCCHPQVLAAGRVELLADSFGIGAGLGGAGTSGEGAGAGGAPAYMALDGAALENLEVGASLPPGSCGTTQPAPAPPPAPTRAGLLPQLLSAPARQPC